MSAIFRNFFSGLTKFLPKSFQSPIKPPSIALPTTKLPRLDTSSKLLLGTGITAGTVLKTQEFLGTQEGQKTLDVFDDTTERLKIGFEGVTSGFSGIGEFLGQNPIIIPLILGIGLIAVVKK